MSTLTETRQTSIDFAALADGVARIAASIVAGTRAARDYERLAGQTDAQLAAQGLSRPGLAEVVYLRHFG